MSDEQIIIEELYKILAELEARELSANLIIPEYYGKSWLDLCELGIKLFRRLER